MSEKQLQLLSLLKDAYELGFGGGYSAAVNRPPTEEAKKRARRAWENGISRLMEQYIKEMA